MHKNALFRGCTRPAMFMGVPYAPFFFGAGSCLLLGYYINFWLLGLIPIVIFIMRQMAKRDELVFRLIALRWMFKLKARNLRLHDGMWSFSPNVNRKELQD